MTQNYKSAYPAEFRQQMVELVVLGKCLKQLSKEFGCYFECSFLECQNCDKLLSKQTNNFLQFSGILVALFPKIENFVEVFLGCSKHPRLIGEWF
jgi:hypothetical protein